MINFRESDKKPQTKNQKIDICMIILSFSKHFLQATVLKYLHCKLHVLQNENLHFRFQLFFGLVVSLNLENFCFMC